MTLDLSLASDFIVTVLGVLVAGSQVFIVASLAAAVVKLKQLREFIAPQTLWIAFSVALVATLGSLFFSEVMRFEPCVLCWYARILMYPLTIILGIAAARNDWSIRRYVLPLVILGVLLTAFHVNIDFFEEKIVTPCSEAPGAVPCDTDYIHALGYQTIPLMAFTAFALILVLLLLYAPKNASKNKNSSSHRGH